VKQLFDASRRLDLRLIPTVRSLIETEELQPRFRTILREFLAQIDSWIERSRSMNHAELAQQILDESGYTTMWQNDKSPDSPGRLENLKELVESMREFETLGSFLDHVSLVMDRDTSNADDAVTIMTLHSAKGLEFDTVFLPGWEEGLFPSQRTLDESGRAGLEEERRLAYVGLTRARKRLRVSIAQNRRNRGLWQAAIPSRFSDELPPEVVEVKDTGSAYGGYGYGGRGSTRYDADDAFESLYETPGWKRARQQAGERRSGGAGPLTIEGELVARSTDDGRGSAYGIGERVFHLKFGYGRIDSIEGNKLTIDFEKAGRKKVLDSFVQKNP
jgi:DNA helicase-2/ATP-dependent DNA helicase PcrA